MSDERKDRDPIADAILIASEQISDALQQVAISEQQVAKAIQALVPPKPVPTELTSTWKIQ